ncbi:MAG: protoheme IX farnesyltransferase [Syntrophaceticus sp.]|jgi:protoheme IX farnesyltransferase
MHNRVDVEVKRQPPPTVFSSKMQAYWSLIKSRQTFLLVLTGWAGFGTAICPITNWRTALLLVGSLFFAVSGATVLNMAIDYDIDAKMERTKGRALPSGVLNLKEVIIFGSLLSLLGIGWSLLLDPFYGLVVSAGLLINVVVYSLALKRRTHFSIVFGGVAGGMPILSGRVLGIGKIDGIGLLLATAVLLWIPMHIMTFSIKYSKDYGQANIPTFPSEYGVNITRKVITISTIFASLSIILACIILQMIGICFYLLMIISCALIAAALVYLIRPSAKLNFGLFKAASVYMLGAMLLLGLFNL